MAKRVLNQRQSATPRQASSLSVLALCLAMSAHADTTTLTVADAVKGTSNTPVTMQFPIARSGDLAFEAVLNYHTVDGTAIAGTDYTGGTGSVTIPAGAANAMIPVLLSTQTGSGASLTFQLQLDTATGIGPVPTFAARQSFITGNQPRSVITGDVNGDGALDLIVPDSGDNTVSVLLNTTAPGAASPSFAARQTFATGAFPNSVAITDVNGDGLPDVVVANGVGNTVSVLLNTTTPGASLASFAAQQSFAAGSGPGLIHVVDFNGDGRADLIVGNANTVSVLLNTTAPGAVVASVAAPQSFAAGSGLFGVALSDLNGDGKPDVMTANQNDNTISVLFNTTSPGNTSVTFTAQQTFPVGIHPTSVAAADINGDSKPDLVVTNGNNKTLGVLLNATAPGAAIPSFAPQQTFGTASVAPFESVVATDFNGDGKPDLVATLGGEGTVVVFVNTTAPGATSVNFAPQQAFAASSDPESVVVADINHDGKPDLIAANYVGNTVSVLLNAAPAPTATLNFAAQQTFGTGTHPGSVIAADVNGDGKADVIVPNTDDDTVSVLLDVTAPGAAIPSFAAQQTFATGSHPGAVAAADLNGDGKLDLVVGNAFGDSISVLFNTTAPGAATPSFAAQQTVITGHPSIPRSIVATDINGDGKPDLIIANVSGSNVLVLLNTTSPGATTATFAAQQGFSAGSSPFSAVTADVNGDGKADLIVANLGNSNVSVLLNTTAPGATTPTFALQQSFTTGAGPQSVTAADVNGDGKPDLITANRDDDTVSVLLNTTAPGAATASFALQQTFNTGDFPYSVTTADLDGDGKLDVIVTNFGGGTASTTVSMLLNTTGPGAATPSFASQQTFATGFGPIAVIAADANGDGKPDLIAANYYDATVSVLLNKQYQALFAGSPATGTIVHDYIFANGFE